MGQKHCAKLGLFAFSSLIPTIFSSQAQAQTVEASVGEDVGAKSDIIVTGTRRTERSVAKSLSPVDVIDATTLASVVSADIADKLSQTVPSFNVQRVPGADGAIFNRPAALRNLSPDQTLVLIDGHRRHRSAYVDVTALGAQAVDFSQITDLAIARIEVLRDGASAQYGSDAIGGVINVILDSKPGTRVAAQYGQYYKGDGANAQLKARSGLALPGGGTLVVSGDYLNADSTDRSAGVRNKIGQPDLETYHGAYNLKLPLSADWRLYSYGTYGHGKGQYEFSFRQPGTGNAAYARSAFQDGPNALDGGFSLATVYPNGFAPRYDATTNDVELLAGTQGTLAPNLTLDLSGGYGRNAIAYGVTNSYNPSLGSGSPTSFNAGKQIASEWSANADASYLADVGLFDPLSISFGASYRDERFETVAGDVASYVVGPLSDLPIGSIGFPGRPADAATTANRHSTAAYLDIEADLTPSLTLGVAGRYEDFSDFGDRFSYKIAGRYALSPAVALRATYNTGFHAPSPGQQSFTMIASQPNPDQTVRGSIIRVATIRPDDALALSLGGAALKPEVSRSVSAGIVLQPAAGLSLTADYYHIRIHNRIGLTSQLPLTAGAPYDSVQFLINGFDTTTEGVDVVATLNKGLLGGNVVATAAYSYNHTRISRGNPNLLTSLTRPVIEDTRPNHTAIASLSFDRRKLHLATRVRYFGSFVDAVSFPNPFPNQTVSPRALLDVSVGYDVAPATRLTLGAENLLDTYPDKLTSIFQFFGYQYPVRRPYEADGGRWYVRIAHQF